MECNKEEAIRARELAMKKMGFGDFIGAQKLVMKAQRLFPDLGNILQLIAICDVHCSAQNKINGLDNWYGILQVELWADEATIKKQYRKLALLLHPDKNKVAGAEAAFKLVVEAHRLLADRMKRSQYDVKYRIYSQFLAMRPGNNQSKMNSSRYSAAANSVANSAGNQKTSHFEFWTCCPFCKCRCKYLRVYANRLMFCSSCQKSYIAVDVGPQDAPSGPTPGRFPSRKENPNQGACSSPLQNNSVKPTGMRPFGKSMRSAQTQRPGSAAVPEISKTRMMKEKFREKDVGDQKNDATAPLKPQSKVKEPETGAAKPAGSATVPEPNVPKTNEKATSGKTQQVSYAKDRTDDDFACRPSKKSKSHRAYSSDSKLKEAVSACGLLENAKCDGSAVSANAFKETARENANPTFEEGLATGDKQGEKCKANGEASVPSSNVVSEANGSPEVVNFSDPEFNRFDKTTHSFVVNQVWAVYDPIDGMPRLYAQIREVFASPFMVKLTWLEPHLFTQGTEDETDESIPIACGMFKTGETDVVLGLSKFSHQMHYRRCCKRYISIYPKRGEIWALFRDWDVSWSTDPKKHKQPYKYDFVEVLYNFYDDLGIGVAYLGKVKGFSSLFERAEQHGVIAFHVPPWEMHIFSHKVPSFKMTGNEKDGVPAGSFKLDPVALPNDIFKLDHTDMDGLKPNGKANGCPITHNVEVKNKVRPEQVHTLKRKKTDRDEASSPMPGTSAWNVSNGIQNNHDHVHTSHSYGPEAGLNGKKFEKGCHPVDALKLRRSARALSGKNSLMNSGQRSY